ncbi:MAG: carbon-monoxide dehydrogenase medium subunit, partial [Verrucomicrobiales bacterium]
MKPAPFTYHDPTSVAELVSLLGTIEDAKLLAGGQSLMPMLNLRLAQPDHLIDLNTVEGLADIEMTTTG